MSLLTDAERRYYLSIVLGISDSESILRQSRYGLLAKIVEHHSTRVYFQNLHVISEPWDKMKIPDAATIVQRVLTRPGGNCIQLNYSVKILLDSLGYETACISTVPNFGRLKHCMTLVKLEGEGDYIVDVGTISLPIFEPIPLHRLPFRRMVGGFMVEYRKISSTTYAKVEIGGSLLGGKKDDGSTEVTMFTFDLTPVSLEHFETNYTQRDSAYFRNMVLFRYLNIRKTESQQETSSTFCFIFGKLLVLGTESGIIRRTLFKQHEEMIPFIQQFFPKVQLNLIQKTLTEINRIENN